jgi:predicted regulator of Ras-like GTPase activity (Roadblock/LC7/MglB family)
MTRDERLRSQRLVFYANDVERLDAELDSFLELSKARCAMLVDKEGHLVTLRGEAMNTSVDAISALIAGSFAATKEMARLLGESEFSILFHQGARDSIQLQLVGDRTLLAILFDGRTNLGMVRFYAQETAQRLAAILTDIAGQERTTADLSADFGSDAAHALDKLF